MIDMQQGRLYRLIDAKLPIPFDRYVTQCRENGMSWRAIKSALEEDINETVSHEALRAWFNDGSPTQPESD